MSLLLKLRTLITHIKFTPFDKTTEAGRSKERFRRLLLSSISAAAVKLVTITTGLISVPLTIHYLEPERYGMWMTASSTIALIGFADFGMGNGLLNAISRSDGKNDKSIAEVFVSSAFFMLLGISILILLILALTYRATPWSHIFNVHTSLAAAEVGPMSAILISLMAINMPLGIVQRIHMGYQEGLIVNIWGMSGAVFGLLGVLAAIYFNAGLPWLVLAYSGGPTISLLIASAYLFGKNRRWLMPHWQKFDWKISKNLARTGFLFFILQLMALLGSTSDNIVISQILGASFVATYTVTQKIFSMAMIAQYFVTPLWPAFGEALARKDYEWAKKTLTKALKLSFFLSAAVSIPMFFVTKPMIELWVGSKMIPSTLLIFGFTLFLFISSYGGVMSAFLNNGNLIKSQVTFYTVASLSSLALKVILVTHIGISGAVFGTVIGYGIFYVIPAWNLANKYFKSHSSQQTKI